MKKLHLNTQNAFQRKYHIFNMFLCFFDVFYAVKKCFLIFSAKITHKVEKQKNLLLCKFDDCNLGICVLAVSLILTSVALEHLSIAHQK